MANYTIKVGNAEMTALADAVSMRDPQAIFPGSSLQEWRLVPGALYAGDEIQSRVGTTAVRSEGKLIIVDTGLQLPGAQLLEDMKRRGVDRDSVDLVVLTHLHGDHVGWNLSNGQPTFPNARYLIPKADWDFWTQEEVMADWPHIRQQVTPLKDLNILDLMEDEYRITGELTTMLTPGHTAGHTSIVISSEGEKGFILGDVANNPVQITHPQWTPIFDMNPGMARRTRRAVLEMLEQGGHLVSAGHFPDPGFGHIVKVSGRRYWRGV